MGKTKSTYGVNKSPLNKTKKELILPPEVSPHQRQGVNNNQIFNEKSIVTSLPTSKVIVANYDGSYELKQSSPSLPVSNSDTIKSATQLLTPVEQTRLLEEGIPFLTNLIEDFQKKMEEMQRNMRPFLDKLKSSELPTESGLSFLQAKYQLLLNYCSYICYYMLLKCQGRKVQCHPVVNELIKSRIYLEKLKPLENKLKYQMDRLLQNTVNEPMQKQKELQNPLNYKPNLANMAHIDADQKDSLSSLIEYDDMNSESSGLYRPPKIAPMYFDDSTPLEKRRKMDEQARIRANRSRTLKDLQEEYTEMPEEINDQSLLDDGDFDHTILMAEQSRANFEEENFTRLTVSKKELAKESSRKSKLMNELSGLNSLVSIDEDEKTIKNDTANFRSSTKFNESDEEILSGNDNISSDEEQKSHSRKKTSSKFDYVSDDDGDESIHSEFDDEENSNVRPSRSLKHGQAGLTKLSSKQNTSRHRTQLGKASRKSSHFKQAPGSKRRRRGNSKFH